MGTSLKSIRDVRSLKGFREGLVCLLKKGPGDGTYVQAFMFGVQTAYRLGKRGSLEGGTTNEEKVVTKEKKRTPSIYAPFFQTKRKFGEKR